MVYLNLFCFFINHFFKSRLHPHQCYWVFLRKSLYVLLKSSPKSMLLITRCKCKSLPLRFFCIKSVEDKCINSQMVYLRQLLFSQHTPSCMQLTSLPEKEMFCTFSTAINCSLFLILVCFPASFFNLLPADKNSDITFFSRRFCYWYSRHYICNTALVFR